MIDHILDIRLSSRTRSVLILFLDAAITGFSMWLALLLRFDGQVPDQYERRLPQILIILILGRLFFSLMFRLHLWSFRYSSLSDGARIVMAVFLGSIVFVCGLLAMQFFGLQSSEGQYVLPRSVVALELLLTTMLMGLGRFGPRLILMYRADLLRARRDGAVRTLIIGAGAAGEMLLRDLQRSDTHDYRIVGFLDDEATKWGSIVGGRQVLGALTDLPKFVAGYAVTHILIAIPKISSLKLRELLGLCADLKLRFKILDSFVASQDQAVAQRLHDLSPQDLMERAEVRFKHSKVAVSLGEREILITGAAGSIGRELCSQLLEVGVKRLVMLDSNENELYLLQRRLERLYPDQNVIAEVANVRDPRRLEVLFERYRPMDIFHTAARKQVPLMQTAPCEAIKTNVTGTLHVAQVASKYGAELFVYTSSDKAAKPLGVMGASKRLGEMVARSLGETSQMRTAIVRFGNVIDSSGSVVPIFREQIQAGGPLTLTDSDMCRYFMTIPEAAGLLLQSAYGEYGSLCVLNMGTPRRILDLAREMITLSGLRPEIDIKIEVIGLRPGDNMRESNLAEGEKAVLSVDSKILVVESAPPRTDIIEMVKAIGEAAEAEDDIQVRTVLGQLVPQFGELEVAV